MNLDDKAAILRSMNGSWISLLCLIVATPAWGGESVDDRTILRVRPGVLAGFKLTTAQLAFNGDSARADVRVEALPAVYAAAHFWPTEAIGFYGMVTTGIGAKIDDLVDQRVAYNHHEFQILGRYRWFLGPRISAAAVGLEMGLTGRIQIVQEQRPPVLLDRTLIGPTAGTFFTVPMMTNRLWLTIKVFGGLPFFVRESPADSGDPARFWQYGGSLALGIQMVGPWSMQLNADASQTSIRFDGTGTRALGVRDVATDDVFMSYGLALRYVFIGMGPR
ncbi:MAG: hypothetical protein VX589_10730 [Myxococcota bacterium]|nr:hypothetical protein [Myxococcota bacterium]